MSSAATFDALLGWELSTVAFVRDYVELHFDGPVWRCFSWPRLDAERGSLAIGDAGYRDGLCALIGHEVTGAKESESALTLDFGSARLTVSRYDETCGWAVAEFMPYTPEGGELASRKFEWEALPER